MKTKIKIFFTALILLSQLLSCKKYLDVMPDNVATIDYAFRNRNETENYLFACYSSMQNATFNIWIDPAFCTGAEALYPFPVPNNNDQGFRILRGYQSLIDPDLNFWSGWDDGRGTNLFKAIRRCNILMENIDKPLDLNKSDKARWIAEAKFLKAYYHFWLVRMYGPIPVIRTNLPINASAEEVRVKREHVDTVFNYITRLLDEAAVDLPPGISKENTEMGRATQVIAKALKAEVLTTQASPLFNGNPDYTGYKSVDGKSLFSATMDPVKWENAAEACKQAIDAAHSIGRKLFAYVPPGNVSGANDSTLRLLAFQGAITTPWNDEVVWGSNVDNGYQFMCMARLSAGAQKNGSVWGSLSVPLSIAEMFYSKNGVPIQEDKTWDYANRYTVKTGDDAHRYYIKTGYPTASLNMNRETRFYASLGFDGGNWFGNGQLDDKNQLYVQGKSNQPGGATVQLATNLSGYWEKKMVPYQSVFDDRSTPVSFMIPRIRLADMYLLYAEALNETGNQSAALEWINKVRARANLKTVQEAWTTYATDPGKFNNKEGLRQIIHQERRIELCFENRSGWDLRRWKEMRELLSKPIQGWSVYEASVEGYYRVRNLTLPVFSTKDYFWPLSENDLTVNPNLGQSPFW